MEKPFSEKKTKRIQNFLKISSIVGLIATVALIIWGLCEGIFTDEEKLKVFLDSCGIWGPLVFTLVQAVQVIIPIVPGSIGCPVAIKIFGDLMGFVYNFSGIWIGSVIAFAISRHYGYPLVRAIAAKKDWDKYIKFLDDPKKFDVVFAITSAVPFTPADFLCYLAGISKMSFKKYLLIITITKPITIVIYTYVLAFVMDIVLGFFA